MNLPESLFEAMVRVPPESMRVLTQKELDQFGLSQNDPVVEEIDDAEEATRLGITKQEFLRRKARQDRLCQPVDLGPNRIDESVREYMGCRVSVMKGLR
jgi:hypothetical protein